MKDDETYYEYTEPGDWPGETVTYRRSRSSILAQYGPHWRERMRQAGKVILHPQIRDDHCIEDWCVVHWGARDHGGAERQFPPWSRRRFIEHNPHAPQLSHGQPSAPGDRQGVEAIQLLTAEAHGWIRIRMTTPTLARFEGVDPGLSQGRRGRFLDRGATRNPRHAYKTF